jgi:hypothetical protein
LNIGGMNGRIVRIDPHPSLKLTPADCISHPLAAKEFAALQLVTKDMEGAMRKWNEPETNETDGAGSNGPSNEGN